METKSLKKQLMAAIAMLVVAAIALASATYAWFVGNKTVTAEGLNVQAVAEEGIVIKQHDADEEDYATSDSTEFGKATLFPTSTADAETWYHSSAVKASEFTSTGAYDTLSLTVGDDGVAKLVSTDVNGYYLVDKFDIRATGPNATDLYVSDVTTSTASDGISKALRVAIVCEDKVVIVAPIDGATTTYNVKGETSTTAFAPTDLSDTNALLVSGSISSTEASEVSIYCYFEGEDENLYSDNVGTMDDITITVEFTASID